MPYEQAISSLSSTEHTTATVFISTSFLQCPHLKIPRLKQGLETSRLSSMNAAMWAYHATLSSQSTCDVTSLISFTMPPKPLGDHTKSCTPLSRGVSTTGIELMSLIKYCEPVMNFTEGKALRAAPAKDRSYQNYHSCLPVRRAYESKTLTLKKINKINHKMLWLICTKSPGEKGRNVPKDRWTS